jgi:hypothetical protein
MTTCHARIEIEAWRSLKKYVFDPIYCVKAIYSRAVWEVEFTDEFGEWWETLSLEQQAEVRKRVNLLQQRGPALGRPTVDTITGSTISNLKELRTSAAGILRILFVFDPRRTAILLLGGDKTGQWVEWYEWAIPEAERLYVIYLEELREEGLIE